jgi:hypothetical protein
MFAILVYTENLNPNVMVMKSAKDGVRFDCVYRKPYPH